MATITYKETRVLPCGEVTFEVTTETGLPLKDAVKEILEAARAALAGAE